MKKLLFIINPTAGKMAIQSTLFSVVDTFSKKGFLVTVRPTEKRGDAADFAFEAAENNEYDLIVCAGGDGTLNETLSGLLKSKNKLPVGYIPCGSTNDFANSMSIPSEPAEAALKIAECENPTRLDIGDFSGKRIFTYIASFGAFTSASYSVPQNLKNSLGHFAYILSGIKDVASIKPYNVKATANGETFDNELIFCGVSNTSSLGGIIKLDCESVSLCDGMFEVIMVKQPKTPAQLHKVLWGILNSDFSDTEAFEFFKTDKIEFELPENTNWTLDGEFEEGETRVAIENLHGAVELLI